MVSFLGLVFSSRCWENFDVTLDWVGDAHVFPGILTPVLIQISFRSYRLLFSHASEEVRGKNMPERNFASTRS